MGIIKGDYLGFTINGIHSSSLGIIRTSESDRYEEKITAPFQDRTSSITGRDGAFYWGTQFSPRIFSISIAFDSLTEANKKKLQTIMYSQELMPLVFDEYPFKEYLVKANSESTLNYICFEEGKREDFKRIYKGEGKLEFIAYFPYARSRHSKGISLKYLPNYTSNFIPEWKTSDNDTKSTGNLIEWRGLTNMLTKQCYYYNGGKYIIVAWDPTKDPKPGPISDNAGGLKGGAHDRGIFETGKNYGYVNVYNPGDVPTFPLIYAVGDLKEIKLVKTTTNTTTSTTITDKELPKPTVETNTETTTTSNTETTTETTIETTTKTTTTSNTTTINKIVTTTIITTVITTLMKFDFSKVLDKATVKNDIHEIRYCIDCRSQLIEDLNSEDKITGIVLSKAITAGNWFSIPVNETNVTLSLRFEYDGTKGHFIINNFLYDYLYY